mmetsp:Transcript_65817/g.157025  ORF Transcript_65817/g.157025 Transcript_65817/m.157025 type:complete len:220 (+) Transcript_65817:201-860(+)
MVFCTKCGLQQADSSKFCSDCANPITGGAKATPGGPSAPDMNARPPAFSPDSVMGAAGAGGSSAGPPNPGQTPPGCFLVQIPAGMQPGSVVTCQVPPPYPQAGQSATFTVPAVGIAGHEGYVYAALPTGQNASYNSNYNGQRTVNLTMGSGSGLYNQGGRDVIVLPVPSLATVLKTGYKVASVGARVVAPVAGAVARGVANEINAINRPKVTVVHVGRQ